MRFGFAIVCLLASTQQVKVRVAEAPEWVRAIADKFIQDWGNGNRDQVSWGDVQSKLQAMGAKERLTKGFKDSVKQQFDELDGDHDGVVSRKEIENYYQNLYGFAQVSESNQFVDRIWKMLDSAKKQGQSLLPSSFKDLKDKVKSGDADSSDLLNKEEVKKTLEVVAK